MHEFAYISKAGIWSLDKARFKILINFFYKYYIRNFGYSLLLHKSENTVNRQKKNVTMLFEKTKLYQLDELYMSKPFYKTL